jgi:VanZ family protein
MGERMNKRVRVALLVLWIVIILILTGYPSIKTPHIDEFPLDKFYHFVLFFIFGILAFRVVHMYFLFMLGIGVALIAELQQLVIPGREFELLDIGTGILGLLVSVAIYKVRSVYKHEIPKT